MLLPHFAQMPYFAQPVFKLGDYKEYVYIGEDIDAKPYLWNENLPIFIQKNTKYKLYCDSIYINDLPIYCYIFIEKYDKTFSTRENFKELLDMKLMLPIYEYRDRRINEILE